MLQTRLFPEATYNKVVNVASVPNRSPFRYPGGKTWLIPHVRRWIWSLPTKPAELIEPFAGGAIVSLTVAFEQLVDQATMVELDEQVAAVWDTILNGDCKALAEKILFFEFTPANIHAELDKPAPSCEEIAFQTILRNRINHGGILAPGSGQLKHGENGKGLRSRWYPVTLHRRLMDIAGVREHIRFQAGDGLKVMRENAHRRDAVFFIDPPYTAAGKKAGRRLYTHNALDHEELFAIAASLNGDFLMTYDHAEGVEELARRHNFDTQTIAMKNTHHAKMSELLIGRNLAWIRENI
jgi:DNA adenine methylase